MSSQRRDAETKERWTTLYRLGTRLNAVMPAVRTWDEVGALIGRSKQNAYTEGCLALGKLAYRARLELHDAIRNREEV